jgi:hypothetical protein
MSSSKLNCVIAANQPIYDALLTKAASYPPTEPWKARAYRKAAESVATYENNIYVEYKESNGCYGIPYIGDSIEAFICNFIETTKQPNIPTPLRCTVPENQPICDALLTKAASYPPSEPWKARAYRKAAESIAADLFNLYNDWENYNGSPIRHIGDRIDEFICNFIESSKNATRPPPAWGASATSTLPQQPREPITAPSAIPQTPPKPTAPQPPLAPKKTPKEILREAMKRMNEEHPEENIMYTLHPMVYGTPYPGYRDEDFDEDEPLDEEELSEEELDRIIERSRERLREGSSQRLRARKNKHRF